MPTVVNALNDNGVALITLLHLYTLVMLFDSNVKLVYADDDDEAALSFNTLILTLLNNDVMVVLSS